MKESFLYLVLNIGAISIPFLASFYSKAPFYKKWPRLILAIGLPALLFILWDIAFVQMGIWGFNDRYLTGITITNLPIEELLFFVCIPYACVFTYFSFSILFPAITLKKTAPYITGILITTLLITGLLYIDRWYTATTFLGLAVFLLLHQYVWQSKYLGRFYFTYLVILIPFFIINGILTGSLIEGEVVWYNETENMGIRIGTIPVEDAFYGMFLILANITLLETTDKSH